MRVPASALRLLALERRSLVVFRVALATLVLGDLAGRTRDVGAHYTDLGVLPRSALASGGDAPRSLHALAGFTGFQLALFALAALAAVALLFGYRARTAALLLYVLTVSLQLRNPAVLTGGDVLLAALLLWSALLPRGAPGERGAIVTPATGGLVVQVLVLYAVTAVTKLSTGEWRDGSAIARALADASAVKPAGAALALHPTVCRALTYAVLAFEAIGPWLSIVPRSGRLRTGAAAGFVLLHAGVGACLEVGLFPWVGAVLALPFLPSSLWDWIERRPIRRLRGLAARGSDLDALGSCTGTGSFTGTERELLDVTSNAGAQTDGVGPERATPARAPEPPWLERARAAAALVLAGYVVWLGAGTVHPALEPPRMLAAIGRRLGLAQSWSMYSDVREPVGWLVVAGAKAGGEPLDLLDPPATLRLAKPPAGTPRAGHRWRTLWINVMEEARWRAPYADYLCREHPEVIAVEMTWMREERRGDGSLSPPVPVTLLWWPCR